MKKKAKSVSKLIHHRNLLAKKEKVTLLKETPKNIFHEWCSTVFGSFWKAPRRSYKPQKFRKWPECSLCSITDWCCRDWHHCQKRRFQSFDPLTAIKRAKRYASHHNISANWELWNSGQHKRSKRRVVHYMLCNRVRYRHYGVGWLDFFILNCRFAIGSI